MGRAAAGAAAFVLLVTFGACGDGDDPSASDVSSAPAGDSTPAGDSAPAGEPAPLPEPREPIAAQPCDGAAVLCVDGSAGGGEGTAEAPFATIGDAVGAAGPGTTIQVAEGTYAEAVALTDAQDVTLVGGFPAGGDFSSRVTEPDATIVEGGPDAAVVLVSASTGVTVEGLRLTGGGGWSDGYSAYGGGVFVDSGSSDVTISGNRIDGNTVDQADDPAATVGGGIASEGTGVAIVGNVVEGNTAGRGAGISAQGDHTIDRNVVRGNTSIGDHGGGIYAFGTVALTANRVEGNSVGTEYSWGGGIIVYGDDTEATLQGNVVTANRALSGGSGVFVDDGADATLVGELYYANECALDGGDGLMVDSGGETPTEVDVSFTTIAVHDCPDPQQGGVAVLGVASEADDPPPQIRVTDSILWANAGVDVTSLGAEITVERSVVESSVTGDGVTATEVASDDPQLVDPAGGDLGLGPDSPATGLGHTGAP